MRMFLTIAASAALLAACSQSSDTSAGGTAAAVGPPAVAPMPQLTTFTHKPWDSVLGYYTPTTPVQVGNYKLDYLHLGIEDGFAEWEAGNRTRTYAPVMLEFVDVTSPIRTNALGNSRPSVVIKLVPSGYQVGDGKVLFVGSNLKLGEVRLDATIDRDALKKAKNAPKDAAPMTVAKGNIQVGDTPFRDVAFTWNGGDS